MMEQEKVSVVLLKFGVPSIIGFTITAIYNFVDAIFIGGLGTNAIGAMAVVFPISFIMIGIGLLFGSGAASYISRLLGEKHFEKASNLAMITIILSVIVGTFVIILSLIFIKPYLYFLGATDKIMPYAIDYGYIFIVGSIFSILNITLNHIIRAEGAMNFSMICLILGAVVNILLDPILIYSLNLGIKGAAIATLISQALSTILLFLFLKSNKSSINVNIKDAKFVGKDCIEMIKVGIPYCLAQILAGISMGLINSGAATYGEVAVASAGIANRIYSVGIYAMIGFSKGYQPIAGFNYGAKNIRRVRDLTKYAVLYSTCFCVLLALVQIVFSEAIVSIFTRDQNVIDLGGRFLKSCSYALPLFGVQIIYSTLFLSIGKAFKGFILSLGRQGYFLIPTIMILPNFWGIKGVIVAQPIADYFTAILTIVFCFGLNSVLSNKELEVERKVA
jgi:putative MATE family efflux protein